MRPLVLLFAAACAGSEESAGGTGTAMGPGGGEGGNGEEEALGSGGDGDGTSTDDRPTIESADAYCYTHNTGVEQVQWELPAVADDPQGARTLDWAGSVDVIYQGEVLVTYTLACANEEPDAGDCFASFNENADGVLCAIANQYTFSFAARDEDGNESAPYEVTGRRQD